MPSIINSRASISRKVEFRITTTVEEINSERRVIKRAVYPEGNDFLKSIVDKTVGLAQAMKPIKDVSVPAAHTTADGSVWSPFVPGPTLDEEFSAALLRRDSRKLIDLFGTVLGIIDNLKTSKNIVSPEAKEIFGDFGTEDKVELLECGYIDFNLDNFIRGSSGLHLLDAEFKYSFGVPKQYVVNRLVISYLARYSHLTAVMASEDFPVLELGNNLYVPNSIWGKFSNRFKELPESIRAEKTFQKYYSYTKGIELDVNPESERKVHTKGLFRDSSVRLIEANHKLSEQAAKNKQLSDELVQTRQILNNYQNHWLVKHLNRLRHSLKR